MDQRVRVVKEPAPIVTWEEMKTHARIDDESEKDYVEGLIAGATAWLDGPTGWLGRSIGVQELEVSLSDWPCSIQDLPYSPVAEVISITYIDPTGSLITWPAGTPILFEDMPAVRGREGDIKIRYRAGYAKSDPQDAAKIVNDPPAILRVAIMMLANQWYQNRQNISIGETIGEMPVTVEKLVQPYRVYR